MARYLLLWEVDQAKIPIAPKDRGAGWAALMNMVKQDREKGLTKEWGAFVGETRGFTLMEGPELEVMNTLQQYVPFVMFKAYPVATEAQVNEMIKALSG